MDRFEKYLKSSVEQYAEPIDFDAWSGIEKRLVAKKRAVIVKWSSLSAVAVAASLLIGLFLFKDNSLTQNKLDYSQISESVKQVVVNLPEDAMKVKPIADQVARFKGAVAQVDTEVEAPNETTIEEQIPHATESSKALPSDDDSKTLKSTTVQVNSLQDLDDYLLAEAIQQTTTKRRTSLSIHSNVVSNITDGNFSYQQGGPMMLPGIYDSQQTTVIQPISEPSYAMPVTVGAQVHIPFGQKMALGIGLNYTYLFSRMEALVNKEKHNVTSTLHYVGIPVSLFFNAVDEDKYSVYGSLGGTIEKGLGQKLTYSGKTNRVGVDGIQFSVGLNAGIEYKLIENLGIYLDPGIVYYFDNDQPNSIRTAQPLQFRVEAGVRFHFN